MVSHFLAPETSDVVFEVSELLVFLFRCRLFAELLFDFVVVEVCD
jgi:hypothetical protein